MTGDRKPTTFAERSLARALARDAKRAERERRRNARPFSIDDLPPGLEMVRAPKGGWTVRCYQPPGSRP